jgi:glutamate-1-semialdehyde 2,1-aminomutase
MRFQTELTDEDQLLAREELRDFIPAEIYDIHAHPYRRSDFGPEAWPMMVGIDRIGPAEHQAYLRRYMPVDTVHGLFFGLPHKTANRAAMNAWVGEETAKNGSPLSRNLYVVSPMDNPADVAQVLRSGAACGLKVYHVYAERSDTMNAGVGEFAPEWMWEILHETSGVLLLHIVRDGAMSDTGNRTEIRRLCRKYPGCRLILAHVARSFNYRHARAGLRVLEDLDNVVVDTSAVTETEAIRAALEILGPKRVLFGSDLPVSEIRGRCVATGRHFLWVFPEDLAGERASEAGRKMTLVGIESLLCLREACEDTGLTSGDITDIFRENALRLLAPHLPDAGRGGPDGVALWCHAREVISCGTGLLSKRAEMFEPREWPSYFSRCRGAEVWDLAGRRYLDFAGGIGAVLLGYSDPEVTAAVRRRLNLGTYCSLLSPQEVELADRLMGLHPWAKKVRYARGGGDAMAMAVRIARAATGRSGVAFCGYHGWHDWYLAANLGADDALDGHLLPGLAPLGVPRELMGTSVPFRYNNYPEFEQALAKLEGNLAAVVMEPMRSMFPQDDFVGKVAAACRKKGAVFVVDEITSGLRYGFPGALARLGVEPDIAVYAKAFSNGLPFGAVVGREAVMDAANASFISSSYWTDGVGPAAALAVLEKMQRENVHEVVWERGGRLKTLLEQVAERHGACRLSVGGMPASPTLTFQPSKFSMTAKPLLVRKMRERGILWGSTCYVMLAHEDAHISRLIETLDEVLGEIDEAIQTGEIGAAGSVDDPAFARLA